MIPKFQYVKVNVRPEFSETVHEIKLASRANFIPGFVPIFIFPILLLSGNIT